jgi:hypothetical protein
MESSEEGGSMRRSTVLLACLVAAALAARPAVPARAAVGTLAGVTQISFGCPGPVAAGAGPCERWHAFGPARFTVSTLTGGHSTVVVSDGHGRFDVHLLPGSYRVTPLPQRNTRGGATLAVRVRAGAVTKVVVRFLGFPRME